MKTRIPSIITTRFLGRFALLALAFGLLASAPKSEAATIVSFTPGATKLTADFTGLTSGTSISTLGWTGSAVGNFVGSAARQPGSAPSSNVVQITSSSASTTNGPVFESPFASTDTAYFQTAINRTGDATSGLRVLLRVETTSIIGFGIMHSSPNAFAIYANGGWVQSTVEKASLNKWYEVRLVVDVNKDDITKTVGHLFIRNVTDGDVNFRLVEDLSNINLGFTESFNLSDITAWRMEFARNNAQVGNLVGGIGTMAVPEPQSVAMLGLVAVLGCLPKVRRIFSRN